MVGFYMCMRSVYIFLFVQINTIFLVIALVKVFQTRRRQAYSTTSTVTRNIKLFK